MAASRYTDVFVPFMILIAIMLDANIRLHTLQFISMSLLFLSLLLLSSVLASDMAKDEQIIFFRTFIAFLFGFIFVTSNPSARRYLPAGMVVGGCLALLTGFLDYVGYTAQLQASGLMPGVFADRSLIEGVKRITGPWGDANEFGPVNALMVSAAFSLGFGVMTGRISRVIAVVVTVLNFTFLTFNRSGMLSAALVFLSSVTRKGQKRNILMWIIGCILIAFVLFGLLDLLFPKQLDLILNRFDRAQTADNRDERLNSFFAGLQLVTAYPFGLASAYWKSRMISLTGVSNPHNGFISTAFALGMTYALFHAASIIRGIFSDNRFIGNIALQLAFCYMFEIINFNPTVIILCGILNANFFLTLFKSDIAQHGLDMLPAEKPFSQNC